MIQAEENKAKIAKQIEEVRIFYPELEVISENNYDVVLAGELCFRAQYDNLEEIVDSMEQGIPVPKKRLLGFGQLIIGTMYRETEFRGVFDQLVAPPLHRRSAPAGNRILIDAFILPTFTNAFSR